MAKIIKSKTDRRVLELTQYYIREGLTLELARRRAIRKFNEEKGEDVYKPTENKATII